MKQSIQQYLDETSIQYGALSDAIHSFAEIAGEEVRSSALLADDLEQQGFVVERGLGSQPTAFRASFGKGTPSIGFIAEYDALPDMSQKVPVSNSSKEASGQDNGHGCGHNLLCTGSIAAAAALKTTLEKEKYPGKVIVYGTPAEETLYGKTQLIAEGYFRDVDIVLTWHPGTMNHCGEFSHKSMHSVKLFFQGKTAHASVCPEQGRSALDACELTNVGVNYLREHVPTHVRMHYSYCSEGGMPNIVPEKAALWYFVRAKDRATSDEILQRVLHVAQGAAIMTDTQMTYQKLCSTEETLINASLSSLAYHNMLQIGVPSFTENDLMLLEQLSQNSKIASIKPMISRQIIPATGEQKEEPGSTDFSGVSQQVPSLEINTACFAMGTPGHHWTITAQAAASAAKKGMLFAAKVLACTAWDLLHDANEYHCAKAEFDKRKEEKAQHT